MDRDFKNVYDLSVSLNLEESEHHFAAKLEDVVQPCSVEDLEVSGQDGGAFAGTFLETGVSGGWILVGVPNVFIAWSALLVLTSLVMCSAGGLDGVFPAHGMASR